LERSDCRVFLLQPGNDPYAFVEFTDHQGAAAALAAMNKRLFLDKVGGCSSTLFVDTCCCTTCAVKRAYKGNPGGLINFRVFGLKQVLLYQRLQVANPIHM